jgi:RNA polymerase sigma-70 factor (ECF subfamily)
MDGDDWLTGQFEQHRPRLRRLCYRMLGSQAEADDALQDAWLRLAGTGSDDVQNPGGWLTTVVARVCLNRLRSRAARPEDPAGMRVPDPVISREVAGPGDEAVLADSVSLALLVVLDTLTPAERLAFVLHDLFDLPFEQIAALVDRSPAAARQLASRARRRVRGARAAGAHPDPAAQRRVVDAFFAAARGGDLAELIAVLDPDALLRADGGAARPEVSALLRGAADVARRAAMFNQPAAAVHPVLVNGTAGAVVTGGAGQPVSVMAFTIADGRIIEIDILLDPVRLGRLDLEGYVLSPAAAGGAVEQLAGDLEVAGVRRRLLDHGQDHLADVGDDVAAVLAARRVRQADAGHDRVGPLALRAVVGQHRHRRAVAGAPPGGRENPLPLRRSAAHASSMPLTLDLPEMPAADLVSLLADPHRAFRAYAAELVGSWVHARPAACAATSRAAADDPSPAVRKKASWYAPGGTIYARTKSRASFDT